MAQRVDATDSGSLDAFPLREKEQTRQTPDLQALAAPPAQPAQRDQSAQIEDAVATKATLSTPSSGATQQDGEHAGKWVVFAIVATGIFMATLDSSIVNISLPAIARYFGVALSGSIEWVIIAYLMVVAATLLTIGRLADMMGRKGIWTTGLIIFTLGSAICGASPSLGILIAARAFQGLGGSLLMAIS